MTDTQLDTLTALDFHNICCQCTKHDCRQPAKFIVETHAVGHCNDDGLNPFGNTVQLLCGDCLKRLRDYILAFLNRLTLTVGIAECGTCGAPIWRLDDILRGVQKLTAKEATG